MEPHSNNNSNNNQFRYRKSVRCIAITDIAIAIFMLGFFGVGIFTPNTYGSGFDFETHSHPPPYSYSSQRSSKISNNGTVTTITILNPNSDHVPNLFILGCICIFSVYSIQLLMGQVLLSATYNTDREVVLTRCSRWYWSSQFLNVMQGIELFVLVFSARSGTPTALGILLMKIIFRAAANQLVKVFMWDLSPPPSTSGRSRILLPSMIHMMPTTHHLMREGSNILNSRINQRFQSDGTRTENPEQGESVLDDATNPIPMYEPPPTYAEAIREKNPPPDITQVV